MTVRSGANLSRLKAKDVMSTNVVSLTPGSSLREALDVLTRERIAGAPVVNEAGRPVGVFSISDIGGGGVRRCGRDLFYSSADYEDIGEIADQVCPTALLNLNTVKDFMSPLVIVASPRDSLGHVARVMVRRHVHRVIITDEGKIVGVVSSMDVVRVFAAKSRKPRRPLRARRSMRHSHS